MPVVILGATIRRNKCRSFELARQKFTASLFARLIAAFIQSSMGNVGSCTACGSPRSLPNRRCLDDATEIATHVDPHRNSRRRRSPCPALADPRSPTSRRNQLNSKRRYRPLGHNTLARVTSRSKHQHHDRSRLRRRHGEIGSCQPHLMTNVGGDRHRGQITDQRQPRSSRAASISLNIGLSKAGFVDDRRPSPASSSAYINDLLA